MLYVVLFTVSELHTCINAVELCVSFGGTSDQFSRHAMQHS